MVLSAPPVLRDVRRERKGDRTTRDDAHESGAGLVESRTEEARLGVKRTRLRYIIAGLEWQASLPVPELVRAVVTWARLSIKASSPERGENRTASEEDAILVDGAGIEYGLVTAEVVNKVAFR